MGAPATGEPSSARPPIEPESADRQDDHGEGSTDERSTTTPAELPFDATSEEPSEEPSGPPSDAPLRENELSPCGIQLRGCYRDVDGTFRNQAAAYTAARPRIERHPVHALLWDSSFLAAGTVWYWIDKRQNSVDWDGAGWRSRFTAAAFRYDNNLFPMNFVMHPMAGAAFYGLARSNDLTVLQSAAYALGTSFAWEFLLEFREKLSINDIIMTGNSGIVLGEFFYKLGRYFNSAPGGGRRMHRALAWSAGLPVALHDWMHNRATPNSMGSRDALGFSADYWHRFRLSAGYVSADPSGNARFGMADVFAEGELVAMPGYLREGEFSRTFADADRTRFSLRGMFGGDGRAWEVAADTVLAGYYRQRLTASPHGLRGHATMIGVDLGYSYRNFTLPAYTDSWSSLHMPGLALEHHFVAGPVTIRVGAEVNPAFTGAYAIGYAAWQAQNGSEVGKDVLRKHSYYYGWGYSTRARLDITMPFLELGLHIDYGYVNSREGLSRLQEVITVDQHLTDRMLDVSAAARLIPYRGLFIEASVLRQSRHSVIESIVNDRSLVRTTISLGVIR